MYIIHTVLNSSDSLELPSVLIWTEEHIQLRVVGVAVNRREVRLDNAKQFACINRESNGSRQEPCGTPKSKFKF